MACKTCESPERETIEQVGRLALDGDLSWRQAAEKVGYSHHAPLKAHMERHFVAEAVASAEEEFRQLYEETREELALRIAQTENPEAKSLLLIAYQNLLGLRDTKPSQQNFIAALKAVHEIQGMKVQQALILGMKSKFPKKVESTSKPVRELEEAEVVED